MSLPSRLGVLFLAAATSLVSLSASAHAILIDSTPKANGTVPAGPIALVFKYNSKIDQGRSRLTLIKPDKSETVLTVTRDSKSNEIDSSATLTPGDYVVRWQALALDGHITRGDVPFTVTAKP